MAHITQSSRENKILTIFAANYYSTKTLAVSYDFRSKGMQFNGHYSYDLTKFLACRGQKLSGKFGCAEFAIRNVPVFALLIFTNNINHK
ncbi:hypothetical protein EON65_39950 [archaeon]|nr:MAG: hypothetical protein EON65_39950 [archaeon]